MVVSIMETNGKPKGVLIDTDLVAVIEAIVQELKEGSYLKPSFGEVVNMLVREALETREAKPSGLER